MPSYLKNALLSSSTYRPTNPLVRLLTFLALAGAALSFLAARTLGWVPFYLVGALCLLAAVLIPKSMMVANQWEKGIVLRVGRLRSISGPGIFFIIPFIDEVAAWVDQRIQTTEFTAEQALTRDTVPVNVDAIVFWQVYDTGRAALEIVDYRSAIERVAQTTLREAIGSSALSSLLSKREEADRFLKEAIGGKIGDWGISVISVEIRDVSIPAGLQDAMSRQAQAEREKEARVILGSAEAAVAQQFLDAANLYGQNTVALQLRAMNIVYETTKERGATILMPTSMIDAMNPVGLAALAQALKESS